MAFDHKMEAAILNLTETHPLETTPSVSTYIDQNGRNFHYILVTHPGTKKLLIHFTAFFGDWGDRKEFKKNYQGYFHRLRMLKDVNEYNCLFLCDQFGETSNGTYYTGEKGDFFVERAIEQIIDQVTKKLQILPSDIITLGSSMGATGALKFGLKFEVAGIVAISPHIDLDICADKQGRSIHVAFICPDGQPLAPHNYAYTRQIRNTVSSWTNDRTMPKLFLHSCKDDLGVYYEQVLPLFELWKEKGGTVYLDSREVGGHGSDFATKALILDVLAKIYNNSKINTEIYAEKWRYKSEEERKIFNQLKKNLRPIWRSLKRILSAMHP